MFRRIGTVRTVEISMKTYLTRASVVALSLFPSSALAASKINDILRSVSSVFNTIVGILFAIATIVFFSGIIRYIASGGDEKAKLNARRLISMGIIGLTLMVAAWGIVRALQEFFDIPFGSIRLGY